LDVVVLDQRAGIETFDQLVRWEMPLSPVMLEHAAKVPPHLRRTNR
jgi:hypothetical protein